MSNSTFDTSYGRNITYGLQELAVDFDLAYLYGTAPQSYTVNQYVSAQCRSVVLITWTMFPLGTHTRPVGMY